MANSCVFSYYPRCSAPSVGSGPGYLKTKTIATYMAFTAYDPCCQQIRMLSLIMRPRRWIKASTAMPDDLSSISVSTWWEERTDSQKLSSDLCTHAYVQHAHMHTHIRTHMGQGVIPVIKMFINLITLLFSLKKKFFNGSHCLMINTNFISHSTYVESCRLFPEVSATGMFYIP